MGFAYFFVLFTFFWEIRFFLNHLTIKEELLPLVSEWLQGLVRVANGKLAEHWNEMDLRIML